MKKVMVGILIVIPIIILLIVAAVTQIVSIAANIGVDDIVLTAKDGGSSIALELSDELFDIHNYVDVEVLPNRATNKTVTWSIEDVTADPSAEEGDPVKMDKASNGSNTTGKFRVYSYCTFYLKAEAGSHSARIYVQILGYDVENVILNNATYPQSSNLKIGQSARLSAVYMPNDSIVNETIWSSDNENVLKVDANGVVTAVSEGTATITHKASVYSSESGNQLIYETGSYTFSVNGGVSSIYGDSVTTHLENATLGDFGINGSSVTAWDGCTINGKSASDGIAPADNSLVTLTGAVAHITTQDGTFTVNKCGADEIAVENGEFYNYSSDKQGYIVAVGDLKHTLTVRWKSDMKKDAITSARWLSNKENIATVTVADGKAYVNALSGGLVKITVDNVNGAGSESATVELNVQQKVSRVQLKMTDSSLKIGIARETVFASEKYTDANGSAKEPNSIAINFEVPTAPSDAEELIQFLNAYKFEVIEGKEYASFSSEPGKNNLLVFNPSNIRGKVAVTIKVSALYPKYENMGDFTEATLTVSVVNGVEVGVNPQFSAEASPAEKAALEKLAWEQAYAQIMKASAQQKQFLRDVAFKGGEREDEVYSICLSSNVQVPETIKNINAENRIKLYGSLYGNNKIIFATKKDQFDGSDPLMGIHWSNVTMSNVTVRTNVVTDEISKVDEKKSLTGYILDVYSDVDNCIYRLDNINVEYCVLENARTGINIQNADMKFNGCIIRNVAYTAFYIPTRIDSISQRAPENLDKEVYSWEGGDRAKYSNVTINNCIVSNILAAVMSATTEHYTRTNDGKSDRVGWEQFAEREEYTHIYQTGFADIYNWQSMDSLSFIDTGNESTNDILSLLLGQVFDEPYFNSYKYHYNNSNYFHVGFLTPGIFDGLNPDKSLAVFDTSNGDKRFKVINTKDLNAGLTNLLKGLDIQLYCYDSSSSITPGSTYSDNSSIDRLHGLK